MYEAFYGFKERPFSLTPDPKFLYLSEKHSEALAHLSYGITNRNGFVMITGEIGTGKTTICRNLLNQLDPSIQLAFIFNPALEPVELLKKICQEFGIATQADNVLELTEILNQFLLERAAEGKNCVLLIDEAQNLEPRVLEQIRLLSNLETETEKLLQIILIGQPELGEKLAQHQLRQLSQRITARYHLRPLNRRETAAYVAYRIRVAQPEKEVRFTPAALRAIYRYSRGVPRVINAIGDRALLIGYTEDTTTITPRMVRRAAKEVRGDFLPRRAGFRAWFKALFPSPSTVLLLVLLVGAMAYLVRPLEDLATQLAAVNAWLGAAPATSAANGAVHADENVRAASAPVDAAVSTALPILARLAEKKVSEKSEPDPSSADVDVFSRLSPLDSAYQAVRNLCRTWQRPEPTDPLKSDDTKELQRYLESAGFSVEVLKPALDQLLALDLPALVLCNTPSGRRWVALLEAEAKSLRIAMDDKEPVRVPRDVFREIYAGEALIPWVDTQKNASVLVPGAVGKPVAQLKDQLRRLGRLRPSNTSDKYDQETVAAVAKLQAETGLTVDGIAGKQVRMVLTAWLPNEKVPRLQKIGSSEEMAALTKTLASIQDVPGAALVSPNTTESTSVVPSSSAQPQTAAPTPTKPLAVSTTTESRAASPSVEKIRTKEETTTPQALPTSKISDTPSLIQESALPPLSEKGSGADNALPAVQNAPKIPQIPTTSEEAAVTPPLSPQPLRGTEP